MFELRRICLKPGVWRNNTYTITASEPAAQNSYSIQALTLIQAVLIMAASTAISGLSLESYIQLYKALTKDKGAVQSVTPIEECYYKMGDLKQLLNLHGLSSSKFNRYEVLQAFKGKALINPIIITDRPGSSTDPIQQQESGTMHNFEDYSKSSSKQLLFSRKDLICLGWAQDGDEVLSQPLEQLQLKFDAEIEAEASCATFLNGGAALNHLAALQHPPAPTAQVAAVVHKPVGRVELVAQHVLPVSAPQQLLAPCSMPTVASAAATGVCTYDGLHCSTAAHAAPPAMHNNMCCSAAAAPPLQQQQQQLQVLQLVAPATASTAEHAASTGDGPSLPTCAIPTQVQVTPSVTNSPTTHPATLVQALQVSCADQPQQEQQQGQMQGKKQLLAQHHHTAPKQHCQSAAGSMLDTNKASQDAIHTRLQHAGLQDGFTLPSHSHAQWLLQQLRRFAAAGAVASREKLPAADAGASNTCSVSSVPANAGPVLLGRGVGFVLMEEMQVAGPKSTMLTLPAGVFEVCSSACLEAGALQFSHLIVHAALTQRALTRSAQQWRLRMGLADVGLSYCYSDYACATALFATALQGRVVKHLGSSCQPELCEKTCLGNHQFYRARVIPPQLQDGETQGPLSSALAAEHAAFVDQAQAAITGRPVLLILDLHPRLRCHTFRSMLQLTASKLQDAWVLLEPPSQAPEHRTADDCKQPTSGAIQASSRRGRAGKSSQQQPNKRTRVCA